MLLGEALGQLILKLHIPKFSVMLDPVLSHLKLQVFEPGITVASYFNNKNS